MKTLNLRSFAALAVCLSLFASCTKDIESSAISTSSESDYLSAATRKGTGLEEANTQENAPNENANKALVTFTTFELVSNPATVGSTINLNALITFSEGVKLANIIVEKATAKDSDGNWMDWNAVGNFGGKIQIKKEDAAVTTYAFSNSFTATEAGETGWRIHVTGGDVENAFSDEVTLKVIDCVKEFTVKPDVTGEDLQNGTYEFTVTYTLTSPEDLTNVKFQGGATSGGQFQHTMLTTSGFTGQKDLNQNTVLTYEGELKACTPVVLSFTYIRKFDCATMAGTEVTGDWKATVNNVVVKEIAPLTFSCN